MKKLTALLLLLLSVYLNAQNKNLPKALTNGIFGKITDASTQQPLAGATFYFPEIKLGTISNNEGNYKIENLKAGKYLVQISYQGFTTITETISILGMVEKNFQLQPSIAEQPEVIVTGVASAINAKKTAQSVVSIKKEELEATGATNLMAALSKTVPGLSIVSTGPAIAKPFIRGLGYNRVVVIQDGIRQEGQQWGDEHGIEVDDNATKKVEVLKGPASLMYGSDALAGVINIQSQTPAAEGTLSALVQGDFQTNASLRNIFTEIGGTKNGISFHAYGSYKGAEDYKNKYDGKVYNSRFYNKNFGAMAGLNRKWGHSYFSASYFNQHLGMIEGERDSTTGKFLKLQPNGTPSIATGNDLQGVTPDIPSQHIQHLKLSLDNSVFIGKSRLEAVLGYQHNQRREFGTIEQPTLPNAYFDLKTWNYNVLFHLPYEHKLKTSIGISGMYQTNTNKAEEALIPDYNLWDIGSVIFLQYFQNKFTISGGIRIDNRHIESKERSLENELQFTAFTKNFTNVSASAGISYQPSSNLTFKWNMARGFRAPNMAELASNGAHEGTNRYEIGRQNLNSEISYETDAGIEFTMPHLLISGSIFYNYVQDFIFYQKVLSSSGNDSIIINPEDEQELMVYEFSQHNAYLYGGELMIDVHPHPLDWLHIENSFAYTCGRFTHSIDGSVHIPLIPAAKWNAQLRAQFLQKGKGLSNGSVFVESEMNFKQNRPFLGYGTESITPSYWLLNAGVKANINAKGKTLLSIQFIANNINNKAYQNHLSRLKYLSENKVTGRQGVFEPGRNFIFKISIPLQYRI